MPFEKIAQEPNLPKLPPLKVTCTESRCQDNLHCYKKSRQMSAAEKGQCRSCGIDLVDWERVHRKDLSDIAYTFGMLKTELVRHEFWHKKINQRAINHALRKGRKELRSNAKKRLCSCVAKSKNFREGYQTPWEGNVIFYAQHATACCCRPCIEYWYDIPMGTQLNDEQIDYFVELIMLYISDRMPQLQENGIKVAPIRSNGRQ